jgi:hypothetical protein
LQILFALETVRARLESVAIRFRPSSHVDYATAACDHRGTRHCRVEIETATHREWLYEFSHPRLVARFDDHIQRVLATKDGFALDTNPVFANMGATQIIEKSGLDRIEA